MYAIGGWGLLVATCHQGQSSQNTASTPATAEIAQVSSFCPTVAPWLDRSSRTPWCCNVRNVDLVRDYSIVRSPRQFSVCGGFNLNCPEVRTVTTLISLWFHGSSLFTLLMFLVVVNGGLLFPNNICRKQTSALSFHTFIFFISPLPPESFLHFLCHTYFNVAVNYTGPILVYNMISSKWNFPLACRPTATW